MYKIFILQKYLINLLNKDIQRLDFSAPWKSDDIFQEFLHFYHVLFINE